jgi:hypothetical protein
MNFAEDEEDDEPVMKVRYAFVLVEEDYEDEDPPESYSKDLQDNFSDVEGEPGDDIQGWDPSAPVYFFRIQ